MKNVNLARSVTGAALALPVALALAWTPAATAQSWPTKPLRVVVPFAAGAATDTIARSVSEQMSKALGQPMIIDNKPGAGGTIGSALVAGAEPDGHTILVHSNSHTVTPATYKKLSYDPVRDLVGVTPLVSVPMVLVIAPSKGVKTLADLVRMARAKPGSLNYASAGAGGVTHLGAERLRLAGNFTGVHVPFKGSADALTEVISGRVDIYFAPIGLSMQFMKDNRLVGLATSSSQRSAALPDLPTTVEAGLPNSDYDVWIGMFAPARVPRPVLTRLNDEAVKALRTPEMRERLRTLVMDPMPMSLDAFDAYLKREFGINAELVKAAGVEPQ